MRRFRGVYPILYAFFDRDGRLDREAMAAQVEHCVAAGAHGIAVLGLVTEVHKLTTAERMTVVEVVAEALDGRLPYAVTIAEPDAAAQTAFARAARAAGADWVILQPPPGPGHPEEALLRWFGAAADALDMPVAIQNNPVNLASSLSADALATLVRAHANVTLLKAEGWSADIARTIEALDGRVDAFGGHGGLEFPALMRAGGAGLIPAPDLLGLQVEMFAAFESGDPARIAAAEAAHRAALPLIVFLTRTLPGLLCYGKRLMARQLRLSEPLDRAPAITPTTFGLRELDLLWSGVENAVEALSRPGERPIGTTSCSPP